MSSGTKVRERVRDGTIQIDETVLFQRLIVPMDRTGDLSAFFEYELTPTPTFIFKDGYLPRANKSDLSRALTKNSTKLSEASTQTSYVVDGGALLHRVYWNVPATYAEILMQYTSYLDNKYGKGCLIVFDGYKSVTKDEERQRRSVQGSLEVAFQLQNEVQCKQLEFPANSNNKERFIPSLALVLPEHGHQVTICPGDADLTIVETALKIANDGSYATVVADDIDIFVIFLSKWRNEMADISVRHETKKSVKKSLQIIGIEATVSLLPKFVVDNLLFIHAWSECDIVSAAYSHGKTKLLKVFERNPEPIAESCDTFNHPLSTQEEVARAGIELFLYLCGKHYRFLIIVNFKIEHDSLKCHFEKKYI